MSSGNCTTEFTRRELATEERGVREAGLLRRALAIAASDYVLLGAQTRGGAALAALPDAGVGLMVAWVMRAHDELEAAKHA